jgi:hypothetical protein
MNSVMHCKAVIHREITDAFAGYDGVILEEYLEAVDLEGGVTAADTVFIG